MRVPSRAAWPLRYSTYVSCGIEKPAPRRHMNFGHTHLETEPLLSLDELLERLPELVVVDGILAQQTAG